jgi:hypothetical protein
MEASETKPVLREGIGVSEPVLQMDVAEMKPILRAGMEVSETKPVLCQSQ